MIAAYEKQKRESHPTRGEWIEIYFIINIPLKIQMSHPTRGEWIEIRF